MTEKPTHIRETHELAVTHELTRGDIAAQAEDVLATLENPHYTKTEAYETYVEQEEQPVLQELSELLINARAMFKTQQRLTHLSQAERPQKLPEYRALKAASAEYNGHLREFIDANRAKIGPLQLRSWLERASSSSQWTGRVLGGIIPEVAAKAELRSLPDVAGVRFSTVSEDLHGVDLVATLHDGRTRNIDIKASDRYQHGDMTITKDGLKLVIPPEQLDGFRVAKNHRGHVFPPSIFR